MDTLKKTLWLVLIALAGIGYFIYDVFISKKEVHNLPESNDRFLSKMTNEEAQEKAELLYSAMDEMGTDEDTIKGVLQNADQFDYAKIHHFFGMRKYFLWGRAQYLGTEYDLTNWLVMELDKDTYNELAENINSPLMPTI